MRISAAGPTVISQARKKRVERRLAGISSQRLLPLRSLVSLSSPLSRKRIDLYLSVSWKRDNANEKRGNVADFTRLFQSVTRMLRLPGALF